MKLKGIPTIEQHIEKIVLGVFVVFAMAMLVLQLLREPNAVELQGGKKVTPATASEAVSDFARQVNSQLESQTTPAIPRTPGLEQEFVKLLSQPGGESTMRLVERWGAESDNVIVKTPSDGTVSGESMYSEPVAPAPTGLVAHVYEGTIDPVEPLRYPELAKVLPAQQPFDARFVSVEGAFDAAALREMLKGEESGRDPLPSSWWTGRTEIFDVELVRERLQDDGSFGEEQVIAPLPGRFSMRERIRDPKQAPKDLTEMLDSERTNRETIRRPGFYSMIAGTAWTRPSKAAAAGAAQVRPARVDQLLREIENVDREIKRRNDQLNPPAPATPPAPGPGGRPGSGGGGGGGSDRDGAPPPRDEARADGGSRGIAWPEIPTTWLAQAGRGGPGGGPTPEDERATREERRRKVLEDDITRFQTQRDRAVKELETLGYNDKGERSTGSATSTDPNSSSTTLEPTLSVLDQTATSISVWAHDISAKAGETYRYKMRVWVTNPFFGNGTALSEAQRPLAATAGLKSADSDWSEPVKIAPATQFFVTSAREGGAVAGGVGRSDASADVEVYEFFYGYWRRGTGKLDPGDQVRASIELPELPLYSVKLDDKGVAVVEQSGTTERTREVAAPTYLLGVSRQAGQGGSGAFEVFIREASGRIGIRLPSVDESSPLLAQLALSSAASAKAVVANPGAGAVPGTPGGLPSPGAGDDGDGGGAGSDDRPSG